MAKTIATPQISTSVRVDPSELKGRRFGRVLTKLGKVNRDQVHEALNVQKARREKGQKQPLGELLVELGYVTSNDVLEALAGQAGLRMVQIDLASIPDAAFQALPAESANTYQIIPLDYDDKTRTMRRIDRPRRPQGEPPIPIPSAS